MPSSLLQVIQTIFFVSGLVTLLQTCFGDRLPIIQVEWSVDYAGGV
jgi:xanthine/uracil permease